MNKKLVSNVLFEEIASILEEARNNAKTAVNLCMVYSYYEVGKHIVEEEQEGRYRAEYGKKLLENLSDFLNARFGKGFSATNLRQMRKFYKVYSHDTIQQTASAELTSEIQQMLSAELQIVRNIEIERRFYLSWSHYLKLMRISNMEERHFYEIEATKNNWSVSELNRQFDSALYERLALSTEKDKVYRLAQKGQIIEKPEDAIKDPYILEFLGLDELPQYSETEMETKIIDHLQEFLFELGKGFTYVGRQVRFTYEEDHFRVDLVFYNRLLRCFVLFDLKIGKLKHQDIGQMQMYVNYYDRKVKLPEENPTIGIVLCRDKNNAVVEMTLPEDNSQIFASKYETVLPSKEELQRLLEEQMEEGEEL